jgi:acetyl-CoA C-acetyltransferase
VVIESPTARDKVKPRNSLTAQVRGRHDPSFDFRCATYAPWQRQGRWRAAQRQTGESGGRAVDRAAERTALDTSQVDDVVLGCVTPIGDQGSDIAKTAVQVADWDVSVAGVQINRFCASGLEAVNLGAMKVRSGFEDLVVVGGVESMSRVPMGSDGGAWALDPQTNLHSHFTPQGVGADLIATLEGFSREDVDAYALHSQQKAARARADGSFNKSLVPVQDQNGIILLDHDEFIRADSTLEGLGKLKPSFEMIGQMGFDATALRVYSHVERINHVHTPATVPGSSTARR